MVDLSLKIKTTTFKNPIMTASGTFGYGDECKDFFDISILGAIITKSISLLPRTGNKPPRIYEVNSGMLNSIGLANVGVEKFITDKLPSISKYSTNIIVNVVGNTIEEYEKVIERLDDYESICGYEVNISCPNVKEGGLQFGTSLKMTEQVVKSVRKKTNKILIIKLTPNVTKISDFALAAEYEGAEAVSLVNTFVGMAVDHKKRKPYLSTITGGFSGPAIKPMALAKIYEVYKVLSIPIIGLGGIMSVEDVIEFFLVGASAVEIGTANFIYPDTCEKIINGLYRYFEVNKINTLKDIIGQLQT
ncbi:MAG TPA: dihydroorotate dehydrogenase [Bacteroidota bacterium]|mgnify:FL=1|jgi:dihydroorotate dehydrogenase (NAD+) catalytic subunit|nr:dihydroorotate dehydrogenase [Bacteroidota bacterium]